MSQSSDEHIAVGQHVRLVGSRFGKVLDGNLAGPLLQPVSGHVCCHPVEPCKHRPAPPPQPGSAPDSLQEDLAGQIRRLLARAHAHGQVADDLSVVSTKQGVEVCLFMAKAGFVKRVPRHAAYATGAGPGRGRRRLASRTTPAAVATRVRPATTQRAASDPPPSKEAAAPRPAAVSIRSAIAAGTGVHWWSAIDAARSTGS